MRSTTLARPVPILTAEMLVTLRLCAIARKPVALWQIERAAAPRGLRFSVGPALDALEDLKLIDREMPPPSSAKYRPSEDGYKVLESYMTKRFFQATMNELEARIKHLKSPHDRDKSMRPESAYAYLEYLHGVLAGETPYRNEVDFDAQSEWNSGPQASDESAHDEEMEDQAEPEPEDQQPDDDDDVAAPLPRKAPKVPAKPKSQAWLRIKKNREQTIREPDRKAGGRRLQAPPPVPKVGAQGTRRAPAKAAELSSPVPPPRRRQPARPPERAGAAPETL